MNITNLYNSMQNIFINEDAKAYKNKDLVTVKFFLNEKRMININFVELSSYLNANLGDIVKINNTSVIKSSVPIYEFLEYCPIKFFIDIDFKFVEEISIENMHNILKNLLEKKYKCQAIIFDGIRKIDDKYSKYSAHILMPLYFESLNHLKYFLIDTKLNEELNEINCDLSLDFSVYQKNRFLRLPMCAKDNPKMGTIDNAAILKGNIEYDEDYFVTILPEEYSFVKLNIPKNEEKIKNICKKTLIKKLDNLSDKIENLENSIDEIIELNCKKNYLKQLFKLLPKKYLDNYDTWIESVILILNETHNDINSAIEISRLSQYFDEKSKDTIIDLSKKILDYPKKITFATLRKWLIESEIDAKVFDEITQKYYANKTVSNRRIFQDKFSSLTFDKMLRKIKEKCNKNPLYPKHKIISHLQKVLGITKKNGLIFYKKINLINKFCEEEDKKFTIILPVEKVKFYNSFGNDDSFKRKIPKKISAKNADISLDDIEPKKEFEIKNINFYKFIMDNTEAFQYLDYAFVPLLFPKNSYEGKIIDMINEFSGFVCVPEDNHCIKNKKYLERFIYHVSHILCKDNAIYAKFLLDWFAFIYQNPGKKSKVCIILQSDKEQCGKGIIYNLMSKYIYGIDNCFTTSSTQELSGNFNYLNEKIFGNFDETNQKSTLELHDILKKFISDTYCRTNKKNKDIENDRNNVNLLITTNNISPVIIADGNARYFQLRISEEKSGDKKYFDKLEKSFKYGANYIAKFLKERDIGNPNNFAKNMPISEETLANITHSSFVKFMECMYLTSENIASEYQINLECDDSLKKINNLQKFSSLYSEYLNYCKKSVISTQDILKKSQFKLRLLETFKEKMVHKQIYIDIDAICLRKFCVSHKLIEDS